MNGEESNGSVESELALADTSVFIAQEQGRPVGEIPTRIMVSMITVGELLLGVFTAHDAETRTLRLETLGRVEALEPVPVDASVARAWAALRIALRDQGRRMPVNDSWIAATALARHVPVLSQDDDYDSVPGLRVIRV